MIRLRGWKRDVCSSHCGDDVQIGLRKKIALVKYS